MIAAFARPWRHASCLAAALLLALPLAVRAQEDLPEMEERGSEMHQKHPGLFRRAKKDTANEQMAYAARLEEKGRERKARRAYNSLVHNWHDAPEAAQAQRHLADLYAKAGKFERAFEEYQYLVRYFAGTFPYQDVLETQLGLAHSVRTDRHADFFFLPGFADPGRAVPLYEQIVDNGPNWARAPEAQFWVGAVHEADKEYELAVVAYETLLLRYPRSGYVAEGAYRRAQCLRGLANQSRRDEDQCREALLALLAFVRQHPEDERAAEADRHAQELKQRLSGMYYDRALYYDRIVKKPKSAIIAYTDFVQKFPTSERRKEADERIAALQMQQEQSDEK